MVDRFPALVLADHATVVDPRSLDRHRTQAGLNRPLAVMAVAYHESMALLIGVAGVLIDITGHLGLDRRSQQLTGAVPENLGENILRGRRW